VQGFRAVPSDPSQKAPGLVARLAAPVRGRDPVGRLLGAGLVLAVAAGAAWLLTPGSQAQRFPGEDALGTPAVGSFKASRDYEIRDEEATARLRDEAAAAEPAVFDEDEEAAAEAVGRIRAAFQAAREAAPESAERARAGGATRAAEAARAAFQERLGASVRREDLDALAAARFAEPVEQQVATLAARGLTGMVVEDRERWHADAERGIVARGLRDGVLIFERTVGDLALVRDLPGVREELRAGAALPAGWPPSLREAVIRTASVLLRPTLTFNLAETARRQRTAADRVKPVVIQLRRGERIVGDGERIEPRHVAIFKGIQAQTQERDIRVVRIGGGLLVALLLLLLWRQARGGNAFRPSRRDAVLLAALFLGTLGLTAVGMAGGDALHDRFPGISPEAFYHLVPFAAGAMLARSLLSAEVALRFAVASGIAVGLLAGHSLFFAIQAVLTAVAASGLAPRSRTRGGLLEAGAAVGVLGAVLALAAQLLTGRGPAEALAPAGFALLGGAVLLPLLVVVLVPAAERLLGYVTDARLLELANLSHPALKDLIVQAPGTYHHSVVMGSLVEAAAEAAGANPLLARVCAYYHDVGKSRNPLYFAENQRGENRHDQLAPSMSALIVKRHVADGIELARRWKLPPPVIEAVAQHHGTRFVSYFWAKARKAAEEGNGPWEDASSVDEALFRYPGPRPRSREAALLMIADVVEASARALPEPTPERIAQLVQKRIDELVAEGQLDECPMTLRELRLAGQAMGRVLEALHRARSDDGGQAPAPPGSADFAGLHLVAKS
jgi:putative nucleotidyltransferase with HDIG domain